MVAKFRDFNFFLLRTPRLPSSVIHKLNGLDKEDAWKYVSDMLLNPEILDAIYIASEDLFREMVNHLGSDYTPSKSKLLTSLYKYVNRMASRPTPYGKFAGVSVGTMDGLSTCLELSGEFIPTFRLDTEYISRLVGLVSQEKSSQNQLRYFTNSTLYEASDRYHYIEFTERDNRRCYNWAWVSKNPVLTQVLQLAKKGVKFCELAEHLCKSGVDQYKVFKYLYELIEVKLIISELETAVTGVNSDGTLSRLKSLEQHTIPISTLNRLDNFIKKTNDPKFATYAFTANKDLGDLDRGSAKNFFQVDLRIGTSSNQIHKRIVQELAGELEKLSVFNNAKPSPELKSFCRKFQERYGDMEIPLLEAIDHERGIGYGSASVGTPEQSPLLEGLGAPRAEAGKSDRDRFVQSIVDRYWLTGAIGNSSVELDDRDIQSFYSEISNQGNDFHFGFYALGNLFTYGSGIDNGEYLFNALGVGGASAIPLMTRFCHLDTELEDRLRECVDWEERQMQGAIFAEVVCLPESRAGNILARPSLFKYEIPIIGQSKVGEANNIFLDDLCVSVRHGKIILRSKRLDKQVIPRLSSAHNFHYGMVVYRFLCDLQCQDGMLDLSWDWGALADRPFTPRISYKHIILARAKWRISKNIISEFNGADSSYNINLIKENYRLPDVVVLTDGDNELVIDLRSPIGAEVILKQLEKNDIVLQEYLFETYESPVKDGHGEQYNNEIIIPFKLDRPMKEVRLKPISESKIKRTFQPGSEWAFIKVYCGVMESERILRDQVTSIIYDLKIAGIIKKWFFIRYHDPDPHIRLRFLLKETDGRLPLQQLTDCLNIHLAPLMENRSVHRIVYDTYARELERYGVDNMEICESIFHADSESILSLLPMFRQGDGKHLRWLTGMFGVDNLFTAFGLAITEKMSLTTVLRDAFLDEFSGYAKLKYKLDIKYRENRHWVEKFFGLEHEDAFEAHTVLAKRFDVIIKVSGPLNHLKGDVGKCFDLLSSLSHMYINRLFSTSQREHEMVIYHLLAKHYMSSIKRGKPEFSSTVVYQNCKAL